MALVSDVVAAYAALLSTCTAAIQLIDWRQKHRAVTITATEFFGNGRSTWVARVTNRGAHPTRLIYVAYGSMERARRAKWRFVESSLVSASELVRSKYDSDLDRPGKPVDGRLLNPGETVEIVADADLERQISVMNIDRLNDYKRRCFYIEHSQSDRPILKRIGIPRIDDID